MQRGRAIITYGRSLMSLVIARSLKQRGIEVIGCDDIDMTVMSFSNVVDATFTHARAEDDEDAFIESLLENVKRFKPNDDRPYLLMPVFRNTRVIARHKDKFSPHVTVAAPDCESISKIFPKEKLAETASRANAKIPKTVYANSRADLEAGLESLSPPIMLKPVAGVGGRGIRTFDNLSDAIDAHQAFIEEYGEPPLIQEQIKGDDYCFTGLFQDGELRAHMAYRNLKNFPRKTGAGAIRETVDDEKFIEPAQALMRETGWNGVAEIDFFWTGNDADEPYIIEVNPRFWAGLFHSVDSGVDFPWLLFQLFAHGEIDEPGEAEIGNTTKAPGLWLASTVQEIADSDINFDRLKAVWASENGGGFVDKLTQSTKALKDAVDFDDACFRIIESLGLAKESDDELSAEKDPLTGLGALFVLSSLARHGRLPDEVKL